MNNDARRPFHNRAQRLDHAKREIVAARFFEIPAETILQVSEKRE